MAFDLLRSSSPAGEPEWDDLYRRHAPDLRRLIARRVPADAPVDDLLQEAFYQAYRSRHRVDLSQPVWPWLATLAHRACTAWWRRQRPATEPWGAEEHVDPAVFPGSDEHIAAMVRGAAVSDALAELSPRHRLLLVCHEAEELSCEHLARFEGSSAKAVKSALARARTHVRRRLRVSDVKGCGLPAAVAFKRWFAKLQRPAPLMESMVPWTGAVVALGVVAVLSVAPVAMRAEERAQHVADSRPIASGGEAVAAPTGERARESSAVSQPRTGARTSEAPSTRRVSTGVPAAGIRTGADVTRTPEGTWTVFEVEVEYPVIGGSTEVGSSVRCDTGMVTALECMVLRALPDPN